MFLHSQQILVVLISLSLHALVSTCELCVLLEELLGRVHHINLHWPTQSHCLCLLAWEDSLKQVAMIDIIIRSSLNLIFRAGICKLHSFTMALSMLIDLLRCTLVIAAA